MKKCCYILTLFLWFSHFINAQNTVGLFQNSEQSFDGYSLFASNGYTSTYLIDNCGRLINEWPGAFRPGSVNYLLEDGHLYRAVRNTAGNFQGGGIGGQIEKLDWEGNVVWSYQYANDDVHQHHDISVLPNGNILVLAWEYRTVEEAIEAGRDPSTIGGSLWPEQIVEIQPIGTDEINIVWEWHMWDHLIQDFDETKNNFGVVSDHPELVDINFLGDITAFSPADWIHANSIAYNSARDEIIISSRHFSEFWIIDHSTTTEEAASSSGGNAGKGGDILYRWGNPIAYQRGNAADRKLYGQHNVHWIPEGLIDAGKIMIFNNGVGRPGGNASSVEIIAPPLDADGHYLPAAVNGYGPASVDWIYFPGTLSNFFSATVSGAQRMPNGNTLICEGAKGRLFELSPASEIVWEYINPVGNSGPVPQGIDPAGNGTFRVYRYPASYPAFDGKDLTPGEVIELNPVPNDCGITSSNNITGELQWTVFPNPVQEELNIKTPFGKIGKLELIDALGRKVYESEVAQSAFSFPTIDLQEGIYFLMVEGKGVKRILVSPRF